MQNIVLCGGPGSGKTTFAKLFIEKVPTYRYQYMSFPAVRIPMTLLQTTHPQLLELSKKEYLKIIKENKNIQVLHHTRTECSIFGRKLMEKYGPQIMGEAGYSFCNEKLTILDGLAGVQSLLFLKEKRFLVIGFRCNLSTQVERRMNNMKDIDSQENIEQMIRETNEYLHATDCVQNADTVYDTDVMKTEDIVEDVIKKIL
ncbi:MAG: zeta toxin family protein [Candidatus Woesearchaeota archaeon]